MEFWFNSGDDSVCISTSDVEELSEYMIVIRNYQVSLYLVLKTSLNLSAF